uniref:HIT domain-containing protein n=1 Tax=Oryza barthii TaxID=65489 RepID=A0A0D3HQS4_9ORYZ
MDPVAGSRYRFGPHEIAERQVFRTSPLSFAIVNLRPTRPEKNFSCYSSMKCASVSKRKKKERKKDSALNYISNSLVKRFADLSPDETRDLWIMAKDIGVRVEQYQRASSLTFTIQDGPHSGQTVPHVHVHIVPRRKEDFENNDNNNGMYIVNIFRIFLRGTANLKHKYNVNETRSAGLKKLSNT